MKTPEKHEWHCFGVFIVNFEQINFIYGLFHNSEHFKLNI